MKHDHHHNADPPITRDGIESWLDVLTSMLSLPPSQRSQVRDELEDHLRSRVDDLLIAGKKEPEAIGTAIAELGETAQLARHISSANRTPKSFRRFAMNATFFILAGSILTAGVSMMMPNAPLQQTSASSGTQAVVASQEQQTDASPLDSFTVEVRDATVADLIEQIDRSTERQLIVHWQLLSDLGYDRDAPIDIDADPITAGLALTILAERTERDLSDSIAVLEKDDRIEIGTLSQFDRRTREERIYDLSMFARDRTSPFTENNRAYTENTMLRIRELLQSHVSPDAWVNLGGNAASASVINTTLVVSSPDRIHTEIRALLSKLIAQHEAQQHEQRMQSQRAVERTRDEFSKVRDALIFVREEQSKKNEELSRVGAGPFDAITDPKVRAEARNRAQEIKLQLEGLKLKDDELHARYSYLQKALIQSEYEELTALID